MFHSENRVFKFFKYFSPAFIVLTSLAGLVYLTAQQNYRGMANDPQIQLAEDTANKLENNNQPQLVIPIERVNLEKSLSPFMITYNENGEVTASAAQIRGKTPSLPKGVLDNVGKNGSERLTWQPDINVRIAAVIIHVNDGKGFVLAGRSLREVEQRIDRLLLLVFAVWLLASFVLFFTALVLATGKLKVTN